MENLVGWCGWGGGGGDLKRFLGIFSRPNQIRRVVNESPAWRSDFKEISFVLLQLL